MLLKKYHRNHIIFGNGNIILPLNGIKYAFCSDEEFLLIWGKDNTLTTIEKILRTNPRRFKESYHQTYIIHGRKRIKLVSLEYSRFSVYEDDLEINNTYIKFYTNARYIARRLKSIIKFNA